MSGPVRDMRHQKNLAAIALASRKSTVKLAAVAKQLDIKVSHILQWMKDPEFREQIRKLTDDALTLHMPQIDDAMVKKARLGNVQAANYIAKRAGRLTDVTQDKTFDDFVRKVEASDAEAIRFFMEHQRWPDQDAADMMPEPEKTQ